MALIEMFTIAEKLAVLFWRAPIQVDIITCYRFYAEIVLGITLKKCACSFCNRARNS